MRQDWLVCAICGFLVSAVCGWFDVSLLPAMLISAIVFFAGIHTAAYNRARKVWIDHTRQHYSK